MMNNSTKLHFDRVRLLALDVDGILTDGGLYYTENGEVCKKFNVKDGKGIKLLMQSGIEVAIISANDSYATIHRAQKLGIDNCFIGVEDKLTVLKNLCDKLDLSLSQVAYMGDDLNDLPILKAVGFPITVADAISENKTNSIYITEAVGGQGAVREVCNLLLQNSFVAN
ncbi:HAD hydrolase family protein [Waterburya agarophytonicola K14]|uniref:HAD hydrolase family protein n=2 Tax=Waterburya TaxID=2886915 RepID=A0A964BPY1_9CYAN|nr:HAD hydrolase family protein [Waterburya agarophytonicola]MCC0177240.1 HAD hydrolase family protein [Waterburya agarophytonicola KI4]